MEGRLYIKNCDQIFAIVASLMLGVLLLNSSVSAQQVISNDDRNDTWLQVVIKEISYISSGSTEKFIRRRAPSHFSVGAEEGSYHVVQLPGENQPYGDVRIDFAGGSDAFREQCLSKMLSLMTINKIEQLTSSETKTDILVGGPARWVVNSNFTPPLLEITFTPANTCSIGR